jgi:hypothetical protein
MDTTLYCRCKSMQVVEKIAMDMAMEEVTDMIMSTLLVLLVKANASTKYNLKMKPNMVMELGMTKKEEMDVALVAECMGRLHQLTTRATSNVGAASAACPHLQV